MLLGCSKNASHTSFVYNGFFNFSNQRLMMTLTLQSPAKINLFLRILNKRPDGYHALASLFQCLTLADTIQFSLAEKDLLTCSHPNIPLDKSNLVMKAADLFRAKTDIHCGFKIFLDKKIPVEAGLGGGSSNAATTLWAINKLCGEPASLDDLIQWGAEVGSDVPFFFSQGTAYCTGRGECVRDLPALPSLDLWIVKPNQGLSTAAVYRAYKQENAVQRDPDVLLQQALMGNLICFNDLEEPAFALLPSLQAFKQKLSLLGFETVMMSGSGSSFFCIGSGVGLRDLISLEKEGIFCAPVKFLNRAEDQWYGEGSQGVSP